MNAPLSTGRPADGYRFEAQIRHATWLAQEVAAHQDSSAMDRAGLMAREGTALRLHNGQSIRVRLVRAADAETIQEFVRRLSGTSRRLRFFSPIRELTPAMLAHLTQSAERGRVFLAEAHDGETSCMVALAQYAPGDDDGTCELALVVADAWQGMGLGRVLMEMLIESARGARFVRAVADVLHDNEGMLALGSACDFSVARSPYDATMLRLVRDFQDVLPTGNAWIPAGSTPQACPPAAFDTSPARAILVKAAFAAVVCLIPAVWRSKN